MGDGIDGLGTESYLWRENRKLREMVVALKAEVERLTKELSRVQDTIHRH